MKKCNKCNTYKDINDYHKRKASKDGHNGICKNCRKEIDAYSYLFKEGRKQQIRSNSIKKTKYNTDLVFRYKRFKGCLFCNEKEPIALDFHHKDPNEKDYNVGQCKTLSLKTLKNEIRKCIVICSNCHRKLHANIIKIKEKK